MFEKASKLNPKRIITILVSFIITFIVINVVVYHALPSYSTTLRASEMLLEANLCNFGDKDFDDIEKMIKSDSNRKVFILGDSITYGIGQENEKDTYVAHLRTLIPAEARDSNTIYNLSSCGSKPLDYYLWVKYLLKLTKEDGQKNSYLIQYNYKWFNADTDRLEDRISQERILFHFNEYLTDEMREKLDYYPGYFDNFASFLEREIPIVSNRTKLIALILNEKSKEDFVEHVFFGKPANQSMEYKTKIWSEKDELRAYNCKIEFGDKAWNEEGNFNYEIYLKTLDAIKEAGEYSFAFMPPYNEDLTGKCKESDGFKNNIAKFLQDAIDRKTLNTPRYLDEMDSAYFLDEMHLNNDGHKALAEIIIGFNNN